MKIARAYKTELDPTNKQRTIFRRHVGTARFVYNWALREKTDAYDQHGALAEIDENLPTVVDGINIPNGSYIRKLSTKTLSKEFTQHKRTIPWLSDMSARTEFAELRDLDKAFQNFFRRVKQGDKIPGYPQFKRRGKHKSFHAEYQNIKIEPNRVWLSKFKWIRLKERGYLPTSLHVNSVTISENGGRWYISVQVEEEMVKKEIDEPHTEDEMVGIDVGVKSFAVLSDGISYEHPRPLKVQQNKLRRLQKSMSRSRLKNGGYDKKGKAVRGWAPTKNYLKKKRALSELHAKIAKIRSDFIHKITTEIAQKYSVVCIEGLKVKNMTRKKKGIGKRGRDTNRAMLDQGWGEFTRQLKYKCNWYSSILLIVDAWFPSTKMCSACGHVKDKMPLKERTYHCDNCGLVMDRDDNASQNLLAVAASLTATLKACGDDSAGLDAGDVLETVIHGRAVKVTIHGTVSQGETIAMKQEPGCHAEAEA